MILAVSRPSEAWPQLMVVVGDVVGASAKPKGAFSCSKLRTSQDLQLSPGRTGKRDA